MKRLAWGIAAVYAVGVALLVFTPISHQLNRLTVRLYVLWHYTLHLPGNPTPDYFGAGLNVLLFVPLGALVVLLVRWSWPIATLTAVWVSCGIELIQAIPLLHRLTSLQDVVTNGVGGFIGAVGTTALLRLRAHHLRSVAADRPAAPADDLLTPSPTSAGEPA